MTVQRVGRLIAMLPMVMLAIAACGSADIDSTDAGGSSLGDPGPSTCDSGAVAATLAPGSTFDYDPTESPADLAASTMVVFRAEVVSSIELGREWTTVTVSQVSVIDDHRDHPEPITTFGAFGAGIEDRPTLNVSTLDKLTALVFAHQSPDAPGQLVAAIEGLWLQCPGERPVPVVATPQGEAWHQAATSIDAIAAATEGDRPVGDVAIRSDEGDGWRLVDTEPGYGHGHEVAIMTSERALDRAAASHWFSTRPQPNFENEVVIILAPAVSGSCPGIIFEGLTVADDRVFGRFEPGPPPAGTDTCTSDANPVAFVLLVQRQALPDMFTLSVEEDVICESCDHAQIDVDLSDEAALETALWGIGTLDIVIDGTPPRSGTANVFRWAPDAALMLHAGEFTDLPRWIQSFDSGEPRTIEGFVVDCGDSGCPEECDDQSCQALVPVGDICSYDYEPENFIDSTVTITWQADECEISAVPRGADQ